MKSKQKKIFYLICFTLIIAFIGFFDLYTGFNISLAVLYLLPILLTTWYVNISPSIILGFVSTTIIIFDYLLEKDFSNISFNEIYNVTIDLVFFLLMIFLLHKLKEVLQREKKLARIDILTGISNRFHFFERLEKELYICKRYNRPLGIIYLDCDNFKLVNDRYGHKEGDRLLRAIGQCLLKNIRKSDFTARLGGDEFAVVLTEIKNNQALKIAKKLRSFLLKAIKTKWNITFSMGLINVSKPSGSVTVKEIIHKSDELMYAVKNNGRDGIKSKIINKVSG